MSPKDFEPTFIGPDSAVGSILAAHVGSKTAELGRIPALRMPVPPAFVLPTSLCAGVIAEDAAALKAMRDGILAGVGWLEATTKRRLGDARTPLFVSVRSGAEKSMPGMLDTILDVGMNAASVHGLIRMTGNPRMAFDKYRRFVQMFAEVVAGAPSSRFAKLTAEMIDAEGVANETELDSEALERLTQQFLDLAARLGHAPPEDPMDQIAEAAQAVYESWDSVRAQEYRQLNALQGLKGTAVTVETMVFGNSGGDSGAGVAFSRDPATGAKQLYVDFLVDAQLGSAAFQWVISRSCWPMYQPRSLKSWAYPCDP
jgi:pyruvate,orthophosphate dikinase